MQSLKILRLPVKSDVYKRQDLVELYLQNEDFLVYKFDDTEEAWNFMEKEELDLALLDIMMPKISGLELCKKIRERYNYPIIMQMCIRDRAQVIGKSENVTIQRMNRARKRLKKILMEVGYGT